MVEKLYIQHFLSDGSLNENEEDIVCLPLRSYNDTHIAVTNIEGLAPMPGTINMDDNAGGDGSIFNSARAQNRNIVITMKPFEEDMYDFDGQLIKASMEACRRKIYLIFPLKRKIRLYLETETRKYYIDGYVETINADYFGDMEGAQVSILCPDPYFKVNWEDVVKPEVKEGFLLSESGKYYDIDMSMNNTDGQYYYLDHCIPMLITIIFNKNVDGKEWSISIGSGLSEDNIEFMTISYVNFIQGDQLVINTKNRTVTWIGERFDDGNSMIQHRNLLPFTTFNRITAVDSFEYYIPGNNPSIDRKGSHRLLFNDWFIFDKDVKTTFIFFADAYTKNGNLQEPLTVWESGTFYSRITVNDEIVYELTISEPSDWSTNYLNYYIKEQFTDSVIIKPILEYEGV